MTTMRRLTLALTAAALALSACGDDGSDQATVPVDQLIHVHDVLVAPGGSPVYLAAHTGLYEFRDGEIEARSDRFDDLMAAAVEPDGTLIASGHPDIRDESLRVDDKPPLLGLVESQDGATWTPRSLLGDADFHALTVVGDRIVGADSTSARVLVSDDRGRTWSPRNGEAQLLNLAVDPENPDRMVGVDLDRGTVRTDDGATTWSTVGDSPDLIDLAWTKTALIGIDDRGTIHRSDDRGRSWDPVSSVPGGEALGSDGTDVYAWSETSMLHLSIDGGTTWTASAR